ncbi:MAG: M15 family metallopeptidase [Aquabacterium sp.]
MRMIARTPAYSTCADIPAEHLPSHPGFVALAAIAGIDIDLRYAGAANFAGRVLYRGFDCAFLRREAADALRQAVRWLAQQAPGHRLRVLDAVRPQRVQEAIWADVAGTPDAMYFADPAAGSIHSYGMAVDLTIVGPDGAELDMGAGFDELHPRSHPALEARFLEEGVLNLEHIAHRELLRGAMRAGGFDGISTEWWHFDLGDRARIRREGPRVV